MDVVGVYHRVAFLLSMVYLSWCGVVNVIPEGDQILPINSPVNITLACNVSEDSNNNAGTQAIWEVEDRQIESGQNRVRDAFENIGIFLLETESVGLASLVVSRAARMQYQSGLMVRCTAFTAGQPPVTQRGPAITIRTYGSPESPGNFQLNPSILLWERPSNIPTEVEVNYTVLIRENSTAALRENASLSDVTQFSIEQLEMELRDSAICQLFLFTVMARVTDVDDSIPAVLMDTIPLSSDVRSIEDSLRVDSVMLSANAVRVQVSFETIKSCRVNFPARNYSLIVDGNIVGPAIVATPSDAMLSGTLTSASLPELVRNMRYQIGIQACSDIVCRNSSTTVPLNTSDVQTARVVFFENNVFLTCIFAEGTETQGCRFTFQVNSNAAGNETYTVLRSEGSQQCNTTVNQRNGYEDISVLDVEMMGQLSLAVDTIVVSSEVEYVELTGCSIGRGVNAASIAVPVVVALLLILFLLIVVIVGILYFRLKKKQQEQQPKFVEYEGTLQLEIKSENDKIVQNSPLTQRSTYSVLQSLPPTSQPMNIYRPTASLPQFNEHAPPSFSVPPKRAAPIEVELGRNTVKVSLNKSALRAMARFQYMTKRHVEVNEGSLTSEEALSLLPATNFSRVHLTDEFKSLCYELPPIEAGGEEERELRSWCVINTPPMSPESKSQDDVV